MRTFIEDKCEYRIFDQVGELADRGSIPVPSHSQWAYGDLLDRSFCGRKFASFTAVGEALHTTWDEGLRALDRMSSQLRDANLAAPQSRRRCLRWDAANGDEVDFDRLRGGQDFWRTTRRSSATGPASITLLVDQTAACRREPMEILWRGAAAILLTDMLEQAGYRVELWAYNSTRSTYSSDRKTDAFVASQLKGTNDPLDRSTLINAVSGWFYRAGVLHELCLSEDRPSSSFGTCVEATSEQLDHLSRDADRVVIKDVWNQQDAVQLIEATLANFA